jgi:diguanylate cyclase (GGDEF)-like protein
LLFERSGHGDELSLDVAMPISTSIGGRPGLRWGTITARLGLAHLERQIEAARWRILGFAVLAALVTALLLFVLAERLFLRPVGLLTHAADEMRRGNLAARAGLEGKGEISMLGRTLDSMAEELEQHTFSLQTMVEERTQELQEANEQLEQQVRTDALTELYNRRQLQESLAFQFALSRRGRHPLSFAMLDVDQFKHYNDTNGHPAGDVVLKAVAAIIRERVRQTDLPCRYGGEEFAVMFPDTDLEQACAVAEELRRKIEEADFPNQQAQPTGNLTISIGVAALSPDMSSPEELIAMADKALYDAKSSGRNRVSRREPAPLPSGK